MLPWMAERHFSTAQLIRRAPEEVFTYVADYRHVPEVMEGISRWEPIGGRATGVGARYRVELRVLGLALRGILRLNEWTEPQAIGWEAVDAPVVLRGRWTLIPHRDGVRVTLRITYDPPAAALGALVAAPLERLVQSRLRAALERMRQALEA